MLKNLKDFIGNFQAFDSETLQFHLPDQNSLAEKMDLKQKSIDLGDHNLPKADDTKKDNLANEIDSLLFKVISQAKNRVQLHITSNLGMINTNTKISDENTEHNIFKESMNSLHKEAKLGVIDLFTERRNLINIEKFYKGFREENNLVRPASYETPIKAFGFIFLIAMIEVFVNAFSLQDAHKDGFIGVLTETLLITFINISMAVWAGILMRNKNHVNKNKKLLGLFAPLLIIIFIFFLNLFFGHYRDVLSSVINSSTIEDFTIQFANLGSKAISSLMDTPLLLDDFKSYLLFLVGTIMALLALNKSYRNDDIYPDYGRYDRQMNKIKGEYLSFVEDLYDEMQIIVEKGTDKLSANWEYRKKALEDANERISRLKSLKGNYEMWFADMLAIGNSLYGQYRSENLKVRTDENTPKCFEIEFTIPDEATVDFPNNKLISTKLKKIDERANKLQDALKKYMDHFKSIENLSPDEFELNEYDFKETKIDNIASEFKVD